MCVGDGDLFSVLGLFQAINCNCYTMKRPATLLPCSPPCPSLVLRFTVAPQGCVCPLKHCHTAIPVPAGLRDLAYNVAYQSKMQGKVQGVSSRQSLRCQV